jgi:hypothetical protein
VPAHVTVTDLDPLLVAKNQLRRELAEEVVARHEAAHRRGSPPPPSPCSPSLSRVLAGFAFPIVAMYPLLKYCALISFMQIRNRISFHQTLNPASIFSKHKCITE